MPPFRKPSLVTLRRQDLSQPWGFRLIGGVNHGQPFIVQKVTPESLASRSGLQEGDELVRIGNITLRGLTHEEVQEIILRCISTIDLFVIRKDVENSTNPTREQQTNNVEYNSTINSYSPENIAKSLTEQAQVVTEGAYYTNSIDYNSPTSPSFKQQYYVKEQESYQYSDYYSPPLSKRPQSPLQKPPLSGRPFSPPMNRPFSPTNQSSGAISYHQAEEQQWLSTQISDQQRDARVFGSGPRPQSSSQSPVPGYQQPNEQHSSPLNQQQQQQLRDDRVFAASPRPAPSPSPSPVPNYQQPRDTRVFGAQPRGRSPSPNPIHLNGQINQPSYSETEPQTPAARAQPTQNTFSYPYENQQNQNALDSQLSSNRPQDNRVFAENKRPETFKNPGYGRPQTGRVVNDRRVFGSNSKPRMQKLGGSFDETLQGHWKEPLPLMKTAQTDQLLPSQTKQQQTYITQTPPTEKLLRPPLTGTMRRRIRPVWPPPDHNGRIIPRGGFSPGGRDSPSKKYNWPPQSQSFDDEYYYENGIMSPNNVSSPNRFKYSTPPPGALQQAWNPRSGSVTPPGIRSHQQRQRVKNTNWPPPSNATPAGRSGYRPGLSSLPGSRRSSQVEDYISFGVNNRIPQTYRPPPGTQYFQQSYHYDTD